MLKRIGVFTLITAMLLSNMYISGVFATESKMVQSGQTTATAQTIATTQSDESANTTQTPQTLVESAMPQVTPGVEVTITPETIEQPDTTITPELTIAPGITVVPGITIAPEATPVTKNMILDARLSIWNFDGLGEEGKSILYGKANNPGAVVVATLWDGKEYRSFVEDDGSFKIYLEDEYSPIGFYTARVYVTSVGAKEGSVVAEDSDERAVEWGVCALPAPQAYKITELDTIYTNSKKIKGVNSTNEGEGDAVAVIRGEEYIDFVNEDKSFKIDIPKLKVGTKVEVYTTSRNINFCASPTKTRVVQLQKATAKKIKAKAKRISGTAYKGSKVKIYKGKKLLGKTVSTKKGKYTVAIAKSNRIKKGTRLRIVSTAKTKKKTFKSEVYVDCK